MSNPLVAGVSGANHADFNSDNLQSAAPVRFAGGEGMNFFASQAQTGQVIDSWGELPKTAAEVLQRVHRMQPPDAEKLPEDGYYYRECEAANTNYIADRFMFLGSGTLLNIAKGGERGFAFMNSHRTGGYFSVAELPYGITCAGRYEQYMASSGEVFDRALVGIYMLKDSKPNGDAGLSTDTIYKMITGGVLRDVSVGIHPGAQGRRVCDVCGADYYGGDCPHYAGSTYQMNDLQKQAQIRRGVLSGVATVTLELWEPGEVSGVYDGAVRGAGFSKVQEALRRGTLPANIVQQLTAAYGIHL